MATHGQSAAVVIAAGGPDPASQEDAAGLARELGLPLVDLRSIPEACTHVLTRAAERVELRQVVKSRGGERSAPARGALAVDFTHLDVRPGSGNLSRKQPLVRAFGGKAGTVVDATAGLGHDAFLLACCGFEVTAIERHPVTFALLRDGLRRAAESPAQARALGGRLTVLRGDARSTLAALRPDAVYIDPMFPPRRKRSALAKKSIRMVRELGGDDPDAGELLAVALRSARDRVVVKRSSEAPPLGGDPDLRFEGKLVRYDVYLVGRR